MATCVSEGSYNTMFGMALAISVLFIIVAAFYTHSLTKIVDGTGSQDDNKTAKHISQAVLITSIVLVLVILFLYFGNTSRMKAAYVKLT